MHPLWLTFGDGRLEARYREKYVECSEERISPWGGVCTAVLGVVIFGEWCRKRGGDDVENGEMGALAAGGLPWHGAVTAGIFAAGRCMGARISTSVVCRLLRTLEIACFVHAWMPSLLKSPVSPFRTPLFKNMIFSMVADHLIFPLPFIYQFCTNIVGMAIFLAALSQTSFYCISTVQHCHGTVLLKMISDILTEISNVILRGLHCTFYFPPMLPREPTRIVIAFLYVSWVFCLPAYLTWFSEYKARQLFLNLLSKEERHSESVEPISSRNVIAHICCLTVLFAILWRAMVDIDNMSQVVELI